MIRFEIDPRPIKDLQLELGANEEQLQLSISRALQRSATTLQKQARVALVKGLDLRRTNTLRKRLKKLKISRKRKGNDMILTLWFGLNDVRIGDMKGTPHETHEGVEFHGVKYPGAFMGRARSGKLTVFKRKARGRFPIIEQTFPIADKADVILEDEVYPDIADIFMHHLRIDLRGRVAGYGAQTYEQGRAARKPRSARGGRR